MRSIKHSEAARENQKKASAACRQRAIDDYNQSPNICILCKQVMVLKEGQWPCEVRIKKFCSLSCSSRFTNSGRFRAPKICCRMCGKRLRNKSKHCIQCRSKFLREQTGLTRKENASQVRISFHARATLFENGLLPCKVCGYDFWVEAAHIKPVRSFSGESLIKDINEKSNLLPLCPNHHLEFDRGKLSLEQILNS